MSLLEDELANHCAKINHSDAQVFITRDRHRLAIQTALDALWASKEYNFETSQKLWLKNYGSPLIP